ncbi:hypothetical protein Enr13x_18220 [Stieleria neptunia]|uniref:Uncharacterized protein n=1 Tax=Stieleria neptunia TaxID=2527979 RepID=A0A518HMF2_9BACT|nr:hypothetical protein [Stieleria neptunia]QDV41979.1 hypothetical protein Enr13x_18220 [Stieleria neptunia]
MKRTAKKIFVAATIAAVSIQSVPTASACGGRGGRVSYAPVYGSYGRAASNYRTTLPTTPPIHNARPPFNPALHQTSQPAAVAPPVSTASSVAAVRPRPRAQVALQTAAPQQTGTPQTVQPQASQQLTSQQPATTPAATPDAESSALAALASLAAANSTATTSTANISNPAPTSTTAVAASTTTPQHIGSFRAALPSNVTIQLNLNDSGTFSWIVSKDGKTSQFSGQYRVTDGRLTLVRSNDLQQMAGKLTLGPNGFTFQLDGANNAGLDFKKVA